MRPIARQQSALRAPLNAILGTEAGVRILRVLCLSSVPLSRREIADEAELNISGVPRILNALENLGVIESIGRGNTRRVQMRARYPLTNQLHSLFSQEKERMRGILDGIQQAITSLQPRPVAAWIEGPVATQNDTADDPIIVGVLAEGAAAQDWEHVVRDRIQ